MKMNLAGMVFVLATCSANFAHADWEYTNWGMTIQQVVSASNNLTTKGTDPRPDSDGNVTKLVAPYRSGRFLFQAEFGFDASDRLASVTLVINDSSASSDMDMGTDDHADMRQDLCRDLHVSVNNAYGPPQGGTNADMVYIIETWQDPKNKNNVKYTVLYGTGCFVQYSAIKSAGVH